MEIEKANKENELADLSRLLLDELRDMVSDLDHLREATVAFAKSAISKAEKSGLFD